MEQQNNALLLSTHQQVSTYLLSCALLSDWSCLKSARQPRSFCHFLCSMCQCVHSHIHWLSLRISFYKYLIATQNQWLLMTLSMISALCATIWLIDNDVSVKCALTVACMPYIHIYVYKILVHSICIYFVANTSDDIQKNITTRQSILLYRKYSKNQLQRLASHKCCSSTAYLCI